MVITGAISRAKLQSNCHYQQTNIQFFTGRMPFLLPSQQCQSTDRIAHTVWHRATKFGRITYHAANEVSSQSQGENLAHFNKCRQGDVFFVSGTLLFVGFERHLCQHDGLLLLEENYDCDSLPREISVEWMSIEARAKDREEMEVPETISVSLWVVEPLAGPLPYDRMHSLKFGVATKRLHLLTANCWCDALNNNNNNK